MDALRSGSPSRNNMRVCPPIKVGFLGLRANENILYYSELFLFTNSRNSKKTLLFCRLKLPSYVLRAFIYSGILRTSGSGTVREPL